MHVPSNPLAFYRYPCTAEQPLIKQTLVLLHGWGRDSCTWSPLLPELQKIAAVIAIDLPGFGNSVTSEPFTLDVILASLAGHIPTSSVVVGWSLGGMLAVQFANRFPQQVSALVTLSANAKFVATNDYSTAMPVAVNRQFNNSFAKDAAGTLKLFTGLLVQGDAQERPLLKKLRALPAPIINPQWQDALTLLAQLDNRPAFAALSQPGLHLLAEHDALVPAGAAEQLQMLNPQQTIYLCANSSHALHWSQPTIVTQYIRPFLLQLLAEKKESTFLDKKKVAQSFSRAAATYDSVAGLQRAVGSQLFSRLPAQLNDDSLVADLGSGTGFFTAQLAERFAASHILGIDIAEGMLHYSAQHHPHKITWLCGDAEALPIATNSVDIIFTSLAIQWCNDLPGLMQELQRILKPGGQLLLATLGPQTLHELKSAWQTVDCYVHVNHFPVAENVRAALISADFVDVEMTQENHTVYFPQLSDLTRELKFLGAHNINSGKPEGLTGRARLLACKNAYEHYRTPQGLPATYDVMYVAATKAQETP